MQSPIPEQFVPVPEFEREELVLPKVTHDLEGLENIQKRLNGTAFWRDHDQREAALLETKAFTRCLTRTFSGSIKHRGSSIPPSMFQFSVTLPTSLFNMSADKKESAMNMFETINELAKVSDAPEDVSKWTQFFNKIMEAIRNDWNMIDEVLLQMVKQTRGVPKTSLATNYWKMLSRLCQTSEIPPSKDVKNIVKDYAFANCGDAKQLPGVRHYAREVLKFLRAEVPASLCHGVRQCEVNLMDNSVATVYVDNKYDIQQLTGQVAESIGLEHTKTFKIYAIVDGSEVLLNRKSLASETLKIAGVTLLMKKELYVNNEEEKWKNEKYFRLAFAQSKVGYLKGHCYVSVDIAAELTALLLMSQVENRKHLVITNESVMKMTPAEVKVEMTEWTEEVKKRMSSNYQKLAGRAAQQTFMRQLTDQPYANSQWFSVTKVKKAPNEEYQSARSLKLLVNKNGLHIIDPTGAISKPYSAQARIIKMEKLGNGDLFIEASRNNQSKDEWVLATKNVDIIRDLINKHKKDRVYSESKQVQRPAASSSNSSTLISNPTTNIDGSGPRARDCGDFSGNSSDTTHPMRYTPPYQTDRPLTRSVEHIKAGAEFGENRLKFNVGDRFDGFIVRQVEALDGGEPTYMVTRGEIGDPLYHMKFYPDQDMFEATVELYNGVKDLPVIAKREDAIESEASKFDAYVVTQCGFSNLTAWLNGFRNHEHPLSLKIKLIQQILLIFVEMHSRGLVVSDLNPRNFESFEDGHWKLVDLDGWVREGEKGLLKIEQEFVPPEVLEQTDRGEKEVSMEGNMWSFGVLAFRLLTGKSLFERLSTSGEIQHALRSRELPMLLEVEDEGTRSFLMQFLQFDPDKRITAAAAYEHQFLNQRVEWPLGHESERVANWSYTC